MPPAPEPPRPFLWGVYPCGFRPGELVDWTDDGGEEREGRFRTELRDGRATVYVDEDQHATGPTLVTLDPARLKGRDVHPE